MTLVARRILYLTLIIAFLAIAPVVIGLAIGVRWDFNHKTIIQTGGVYARSIPTQTTATLGDTVKNGSPHEFRYVTPGDYPLTLSAAGYHNIETSVSVRARGVARLDGIELIPESPSKTSTIQGDAELFSSPFLPLAIAVSTNEHTSAVQVIKRGNLDQQFTITHPVERVIWNTDEKDFLLLGNDTLSAIIDNELYGPLEGVSRAFFTSTNGMLRIERTEEVFLTDVHTLSTTNTSQELFNHSRFGTTLSIHTDKNLDVISLETNGTTKDLARVARVQMISQIPDGQLLIHSSDALYIFSFEKKKLAKIDDEVTQVALFEDTLAYTSAFELWTFNLQSYEKTFQTRFGSSMQSLAFSPKGSALLLTHEESLYVWYLATQHQYLLEIPFEQSSKIYAQQLSTTTFGLFEQQPESLRIHTYSY